MILTLNKIIVVLIITEFFMNEIGLVIIKITGIPVIYTLYTVNLLYYYANRFKKEIPS